MAQTRWCSGGGDTFWISEYVFNGEPVIFPKILNMEYKKEKSRVSTGIWIKRADKVNSIVGGKELSLDILG